MNEMTQQDWPELDWNHWRDTAIGLQLRCQIVGKVRLALTPWLNHSWHVPFYLTARGWTTSAIPCGSRILQIDFDLIGDAVTFATSDGATRSIALAAGTIADFHRAVVAALEALDVAGALRHHLLRDDLIARMMPKAVGRRPALSVAVVVALAACVAAFFTGSWRYRGHAETPLPSQPLPSPVSTPDVPLAPASPTPTPEASASPTPSPSPSATPTSAAVPVRSWKLAPGGTLGFHTVYSGEAINGRFTRWTADIQFSPDDLAHSKIAVDIDLASVSSGDSERDDTLKGDDFFGVGAHPKAHFAATRIRKQGNGYVADGTLDLAGASKAVPVSFTLKIDGNHAQASGTATVKRLSFGVGKGQWSDASTIPDGIAVSFRFAADAK